MISQNTAEDMKGAVTYNIIVFLASTTESESESPFLDYYDKLWIGVGAGLGAAVLLVAMVLLALCIPLCANYHRKKKMFSSLAKVTSDHPCNLITCAVVGI